jgi:hypothetical protein
MPKEIKNVGASVRARLQNLSRETGQSFELIRETVVAEKFQAMVALGRANSRMKDFYDIWLLSQSFPFDDDRLARAIAATFERRETEIPAELPDALTPAFAEDEQKQRQWNTFVENVALRPGSLADVIASIARFVMPHADSATKLQSKGRGPRGDSHRLG